MPQKHKITQCEMGLLQIYLKPSDRRPRTAGFLGLMGSRPLYRELVDAARKDGFMNAVAHHTHYGFSNHGLVHFHNPETGNPSLTMCVELVGEKARLERFCHEHGELLRTKVILYKHIEHWTLHDSQLEEQDASAKDLRKEGFDRT